MKKITKIEDKITVDDRCFDQRFPTHINSLLFFFKFLLFPNRKNIILYIKVISTRKKMTLRFTSRIVYYVFDETIVDA